MKLRRILAELKAQSMMTRPIKAIYEFSLSLTDQLWNVLALTPEERAIVDASSRPGRFTLEQWGRFNRFQVSEVEGGQVREWTGNRHTGWRGWPNHWRHMTLWELKLPSGHIRLEWREGVVRLFAYGGRFGGKIGLEGWEPAPEYAFFSLSFPFELPYRSITPEVDGEFYESLGQYLMTHETPSSHSFLRYSPQAGRDVYLCDKQEEKGFCWILERYDLRPILTASVEKIHKKWWSGELEGITLHLREVDLKVWAEPSAVEPDEEGQTTICYGEVVELVLNQNLKVDRIWPYGVTYGVVALYLVLRCQQCSLMVSQLFSAWPWDAEKRKKVCGECSQKLRGEYSSH